MSRYDQVRNKDKKSAGTGIRLLMVLTILAGAGWFYFTYRPSNTATSPQTQVLALPSSSEKNDTVDTLSLSGAINGAATAEPTPDKIIELKPDNSFILPDLDNSDALLREELLGISSGLAEWLNSDGLIRKYVVIANDFAQGLRLADHMRFVKPEQPFAVVQDNEKLSIATQSYQRYDRLAAAINTLDVSATLAVYKKFRPLVLQVFKEFSYPDQYSPEDILTKAAAVMLATPVIEGQIALLKHATHYKFADPQLESSNSVQKQMLRMGPENTRIIQNKLRSLVEALADLKE